MSSYCANHPDKCELYANDFYNKEFDELTDEQKKFICEECYSYRQAEADYIYEQIKDRRNNE